MISPMEKRVGMENPQVIPPPPLKILCQRKNQEPYRERKHPKGTDPPPPPKNNKLINEKYRKKNPISNPDS